MKLVREHIYEQWVGTSSIDVPISYSSDELEDVNIEDMIPSSDVRLSPTEFNTYIDNLINIVLKEEPNLALYAFKTTLKNHPYLTRKTIGFKGSNPYENTIKKFLFYLNKMANN